MENILNAEFRLTKIGAKEEDNVYELICTLDKFDTVGPKVAIKILNKKQYDFIQYHLRNLI